MSVALAMRNAANVRRNARARAWRDYQRSIGAIHKVGQAVVEGEDLWVAGASQMQSASRTQDGRWHAERVRCSKMQVRCRARLGHKMGGDMAWDRTQDGRWHGMG